MRKQFHLEIKHLDPETFGTCFTTYFPWAENKYYK